MSISGALARTTLIPLFVGLLTFGAFFGFFLVERKLEQERLLAELDLLGSSFAARLESFLEARLNAARLLGRDMSAMDVEAPEQFRRRAALLHDLFGDFQALSWVDRDGIIRVVTPLQGNEAAQGLDLRTLPLPAAALDLAEETGQLTITPPLELAQGGNGFVAYQPFGPEDTIAGFLNIVFRAGPLMTAALGEDVTGDYSYRVMDGDALLYATGTPDAQTRVYSETLIPAENRTWQLKVAASDERLAAIQTPLDEAILALGLLSAVLTGFLAHLALRRQAALRESRAQFQDFATASSDWFWETDADLRFTYFTDGVEGIFGLSFKHVMGRRREDFRVPGDDDAAWAAHLSDLAAHRSFREFQYATLVGGEKKWVRASGVPRFDDTGTFVGYRGTARDVTDLVRSRAAAEKANARLAAAVENLDEVFSLWDADDRLIFGNRLFRDLNKDVPHVLRPGTRFEDYLRAGIEAGHMRDIGGSVDAYVASSLARRQDPGSEPFEITRADGRTLLLHEQPLDDGGIVAVGLDVTGQRRNEAALRASEERLALAVNQVSIWDWDLETGALYMSPGFHRSLGYTDAEFEAIKAGSVADIIHPDDVDAYRAKLHAHLRDPATTFRNQHRFRTRSGEYRWFLGVGQVLRDPSGRAIRSNGVLTDITERIELEEQLQQARKMEAIGNLTGGVAHDFNNLLAVILGNLELIRETDDPAELAQFSDAAIAATRRGAELVKNMLSFARKARLDPRPLDLNAVVAEMRRWCARVLPASITVRTVAGAGLWTVETDPNLVQNALLNLVLNARDAMPNGGTLRIETANLRLDDPAAAGFAALTPGLYVVLTVSDTGTGIPAEHLGSVFEPFFTTKPPGAGSGLGLSMVHGFLEQSGGLVRVSSEPGEGAVFQMILPAVQETPGNEARVPAAQSTADPAKARILLVEDEPAVLAVVSKILSNAGYDIASAPSGDDALILWQENPAFDLLITDVVMPGTLQGPQLAQALRQTATDLPVIFLSGYANEAASDGYDALPGDIRLMKPLSNRKLLVAVAEALGSRP